MICMQRLKLINCLQANIKKKSRYIIMYAYVNYRKCIISCATHFKIKLLLAVSVQFNDKTTKNNSNIFASTKKNYCKYILTCTLSFPLKTEHKICQSMEQVQIFNIYNSFTDAKEFTFICIMSINFYTSIFTSECFD